MVNWLRSLRIRRLLIVFFLLLTSLVLGLLGLVLYYQVSRYLWRATEDGLQRRVEAAWRGQASAQALRSMDLAPLAMPAAGVPRLQEIVAELGSSPGIQARLLAPDGEVVPTATGSQNLPGVPPGILAELRNRWTRDHDGKREIRRRASLTYQAVSAREPWLVVLLPVEQEEHLVAVVQVAGNWQEPSRFLAVLQGYLVGTLLGAWLLCLAGCFYLSRLLAQPVERMIQTVEQVAGGDLDSRVALGAGDNEIYRLATHFDAMVERLQGAFQAQRRFVADASHELQTPLTNIGGMADVLRLGMDSQDPARRQKALDTIAREVDRMSRLVSDLLLLSRAEDAPLSPETIQVRELVEEAAGYVQSLPHLHAFTWESEDGLAMEGDVHQVQRALHNLLDNAFKYSPAEGDVSLRAFGAQGRICLEVTDHGDGIGAEDLPRVFDRFYRADPSRSRKTGGTGLGLAIVRSIVERHGGQVEIDSRLGEGTVVRLWWPASPTAPT